LLTFLSLVAVLVVQQIRLPLVAAVVLVECWLRLTLT
jgi:hypothetical protein